MIWNYLAHQPPPSTDTIGINGYPVEGSLVGSGWPGLCWELYDYDAVYLAELAPGTLSASIFPNYIEGATDKELSPGNLTKGEGCSLLTIYELPGAEPQVVALYHSFTGTESSPIDGVARAEFELPNTHWGGYLHFFTTALDGQATDDIARINSVNVGGLLPGTYLPTDAWRGLLGRLNQNNYYDHADGVLGTWAGVAPGDTALTLQTYRGTADCVGHSFAAVAMPNVCLAADVNCDGAVDSGDLLSIRAPGTWGFPVHCPPEAGDAGEPRADVDNSGTVDSGDLLAVRAPGTWNAVTGPCTCLDHCPGGESLMGGGEMLAMAADSANEADAGSTAPTPQTLAVQFLGPGGVTSATMAAGSSYSLAYNTSLAQVDFALVAARPLGSGSPEIAFAPAPAGPFANPAAFAAGTAEAAPGDVVSFAQSDLGALGPTAGSTQAMCTVSPGSAGQYELSVTMSGLDAAGAPAAATGSLQVTVNP